MRQYKLIGPAVSFLALSLLLYCNQSKKTDKSDKTSTEKVQDSNSVPPHSMNLNENADTTVRSELDFLKGLSGKYPNDVKLLENAAFTKRLKTLTGNRYGFLKETWAVETPMEVKDNIFVASACMAHNCGSTNFIVAVDLTRNKMYAGIREDDKVKSYGEDANHPQALKDWEKGF